MGIRREADSGGGGDGWKAPSARPGRAVHPGLDGLRGAAVAAVLLFHGGFTWATGGYLGVSTFFTLSGFLITGLLLGITEAVFSQYVSSFYRDVYAFGMLVLVCLVRPQGLFQSA